MAWLLRFKLVLDYIWCYCLALLIPFLFSLKANSTGSKSSTAAEKSGAERPANRWLVAAEVLCGLLLWTFTSFGV